MSSLEKARQFAAKKLTKLALAVVPLAAMVVSEGAAKATPLTIGPTTSGSFYGGDINSSFSNPYSFASSSATPSNPNATAVTIHGSQSIFQSGGGQYSYFFGAAGPITGTFDSTVGGIPFSYDFTLSSLSPNDDLSWVLTLAIDSVQVANVSGARNNGLQAQQFTGSGIISPTNTDPTGYRFQLTVNLTTVSDNTLQINIPAGTSLDINTVSSAAAIPEPGSAVLLVSAAGGIFLLRRRKKS